MVRRRVGPFQFHMLGLPVHSCRTIRLHRYLQRGKGCDRPREQASRQPGDSHEAKNGGDVVVKVVDDFKEEFFGQATDPAVQLVVNGCNHYGVDGRTEQCALGTAGRYHGHGLRCVAFGHSEYRCWWVCCYVCWSFCGFVGAENRRDGGVWEVTGPVPPGRVERLEGMAKGE
jgi:hypothetical protein